MRRDDSRERAERNDFAPVGMYLVRGIRPYLLKPGYWLARQIPSMREGATRPMVAALVRSVEASAAGTRIVEVPEIAAGGRLPPSCARAPRGRA
jgi:hypothetical protein